MAWRWPPGGWRPNWIACWIGIFAARTINGWPTTCAMSSRTCSPFCAAPDCYQQLRRAGDPAHGDGSQNLGRQSNGDRRPHAADFGQRLTHLLAARPGCLWPVGEVTALCSTHLAGNRPPRTITLSGPATCSTPAPFDRRNHPRPPKPIQRDSRAYAEVCLARGKHSQPVESGSLKHIVQVTSKRSFGLKWKFFESAAEDASVRGPV